MTRVRLRILISVMMLVIVIGAIALFIATQNLRNAPLTVGSGNNDTSDIESTANPENTPEAGDELAMCERLPGELAYNSNSAGTWDIMFMAENMEMDESDHQYRKRPGSRLLPVVVICRHTPQFFVESIG